MPPEDHAAVGLIIDRHADRVRDNLANLLVDHKALSEDSEKDGLNLDPPTNPGFGAWRWPSGCDFVPLS